MNAQVEIDHLYTLYFQVPDPPPILFVLTRRKCHRAPVERVTLELLDTVEETAHYRVLSTQKELEDE